ncbi:DUF2306 domain-containing protein [Robiginitalea marina]|uniref:DUF2306 domain-containing protein n=1 Tax=Robiginitalea marina TaxID=2954105 RepID=A0ABT1AZ13_9FLAO|nr:DUF2306 domain-containing protein [Robiginitalea marina]
MKSVTNQFAWVAFGMLAIAIGLYPLLYWVGPVEEGLLATKSEALLSNPAWNIAFYGHVSFGGLALLTGWTQFSRELRRRRLSVHRRMGKIYVASALTSGACGIYLAFFATGGWVAGLGFFLLGTAWIFFTVRAYAAARARDLDQHEAFMIYSFAACFAAVTLRIWLPLLSIGFGDFVVAYQVVAWLCWVPNLIFAYFWVRSKGLLLG